MDKGLLEQLSVVTEEEQRILDGRGLDMQLYGKEKRNAVEAERFLQSRLIDIRTHTRFTAFPRHKHDFIEIMYVCSGAIIHVVGGREVTIRAGELLLLGCNTLHEIRSAGQADIGINFLIRPAFFRAAFEMMDQQNALSEFIIDSLSGAGGDDEYLHFTVAQVLPVQNLLENLVYSLVNREQNCEKINEMTMGILFLWLVRQTELAESGGGAPRAVAMRALYYVEQHYQNATLREFAARNELPEYAASRIIKNQLGTSFRNILMEKRFLAAVQLLDSTQMNVSEIIAVVGYQNTSYFYRTFQEKYHSTPQEYRRRKRD